MKRFYRHAGRMTLFMLILASPILSIGQLRGGQQQEEKELAPVSRNYAIQNATVIQGPGRKIENATVIIRNGLITAVGKNVAVPPDAITIQGDSLFVYAGFIDGLSRTSVTKPKEENRERPKDPGNPSPEIAGINPQVDVRASINPADKSVEDWRALGFTTAQVVPYGNFLPGQASIIQLSGQSVDGMVIGGKTALYSELTGAQRAYPQTVIAVLSKWKELYRQASQNKTYEAQYASNRGGLTRPTSDRILEAFYPVIDKRMPVLFEADRYLETQRVIALQNEFGFPLILGDVKEGWDAISKIKSSGAKVFLSLDLPEDKKDSKKKDDSKPEAGKSESVSTYEPGEKEALEKRKTDFINLYVSQAATFQKAGVVFGFSGLSVKTSDVKTNLRRMIKAGLTEDQALAALTTNPAQLLGLSDRMGTVDNGKIANLVISEKPYFNEKSNVRYVFVDGTMYKYDAKSSPKGDPNAKVNIGGTWSVTIETPQSNESSTLTIKKDGDNYTGSIVGGRLPQAVTLDRVELNGNALKYSYTVSMGGQSLKVEVDATVEGNTFKGSASAGNFGSFPVSATKDPNR